MNIIEQKLVDVIKGRQIVYWGAGRKCQNILQRFKKLEPDFIIDKYCQEKLVWGKMVKHPDEITDWSNIYVIITCLQYKEIEQELKSYGLEEKINFENFRDFFDFDNLTILKGIESVRNKVNANPDLKSRILIQGHVWDNRNSKVLAHFYSQYVKDKGENNYVLLARLGGELSEEEAIDEVGFEVIDKPTICNWNGRAPEQLNWNWIVNNPELTNEECQWIDGLESIKLGDNGKELETRKVTESIYYYYREIINLLEPKGIVIWGGWQREAYILEHFAKKYNVPYGFMEHGWIPGTVQFDKGGIAGQSEYARNPSVMENRSTHISSEEVRRICKFVTDLKLDSGNLAEPEAEEEILDSIDDNKKTIFLVGMDDYSMAMNPASDYWKQYVSCVVDSTQQAFELLEKECIKNNWNLIYKPHPCRARVNLNDQTTDDQKQHAYIFYKMPVDRLIEKADVVVSISSAVEYKALMYGKPLVQMGKSSLTGQGCSYEIILTAEVGTKMIEAVNLGMTELQKENFEIFVAKLLDNYLWDDLSERPLRYGRAIEMDFFKDKHGL